MVVFPAGACEIGVDGKTCTAGPGSVSPGSISRMPGAAGKCRGIAGRGEILLRFFLKWLLPRASVAGIGPAILAVALPALVAAEPQPMAAIQAHPAMRKSLDWLKANNAWTLAQQISICEIPAPPFTEKARGVEFARRLQDLGLENIRTDAEGNVIGEWPGAASSRPLVIFSAHLDTVFPEGSDVRVTRQGTRLTGLGIGDDCRGLAVLLAVARAFQQNQVRFAGRVLFVGTVGEEGQGDLRGVRYLFEKSELKGQVDYFVSVDGAGARVTSGGVGSHRYKVTYRGRGGHSYSAFGMPNPAHALGRAMARIADLQVPKSPRTTFNIGMVSGGTSVNSIPIEASMEVDLRSESPLELKALDERFRAALQMALTQEKQRWPESAALLELEVKTMGIRPATEASDERPIVRAALEAAQAAGLTIFGTGAGSTDSNIPLALGIPAVTIGGGGAAAGAHSLDEYYDDRQDGWKGPQWAALLVASLGGLR